MLHRPCTKSEGVLADSLQVREALMKKVSRERVGQELDGMFNGMHNIGSGTCTALLLTFTML